MKLILALLAALQITTQPIVPVYKIDDLTTIWTANHAYSQVVGVGLSVARNRAGAVTFVIGDNAGHTLTCVFETNAVTPQQPFLGIPIRVFGKRTVCDVPACAVHTVTLDPVDHFEPVE